MRILRDAGLLDLNCLTVSGETLGRNLEWWEKSDRRKRFRDLLATKDHVDADDVIMTFEKARSKGLTSSMTFPRGNLCPDGSVIKSTSIDASVVGTDGVYRKTGPAKVFVREKDAVAAIKGSGSKKVVPGDVLVLCARGPMGSGMEETYQVTSANRLPCLPMPDSAVFRPGPASAMFPRRRSPAGRSGRCVTGT